MKIRIKNLGPIREADVTLGDLNIIVGLQASGKSLFWQLLKLLLDAPVVRDEFQCFNIDWGKDFQGFLSLYFGEGMEQVIDAHTEIHIDGHPRPLDNKLFDRRKWPNDQVERMFYVPASG
jgi:predicted ATP-dependent endonuclease of OLD family